jgi:lambda family phage tail tape measure protein
MANMIGRLGVVLGLDSAEFVRGIDGASKRLDAFADKAVTAGRNIGLALAAAGAASLKYADDIYDVAKANDVAVDSIVKLKMALSQSGGESGNASKLISSFTMYVDKAATGSLDAQKNFAKLGISLKDIGNMSMDQIFAKTVDSIAQINDPITRNAKAMEMFGKAAKGVDMIGFADEMANAAKVSQQTAKGVEEAGKFFDLMDKMVHKSAMTMTSLLAPSLQVINKLLDGFLNKNVSLIDSIHDLYNLLAPGMIRERQPLFMKKTPGGQRITPFDLGDDETPKRATKKAVDPEIEKAIRERTALLLKGYNEEQRAIEESRQEWIKYTDELAKNASAYREQYKLSDQQLNRDREIMLLEKKNLDLKSYEVDYAKQILSIRNQYQDKIYAIGRDEKLTADEKEAALEREVQLRDKSISQAREVLDITRQESEGSFQKGFGKGFDEFVRNMPNQLEIGRQSFSALMNGMESALQNFVRTGKFSFKDFARSLIQDMIMIQARAQMMSMTKGLYSLFGGGTPSVDLGSAYGGGSAGSVGISGFADGGSPPVGRPSLVGERGPELFVPRTAGTIIPNNQLASAMGGGQTVNYNGPYIASMNAIDTQSAAQFLAKNKQAVWATYQSANRSIPVTR